MIESRVLFSYLQIGGGWCLCRVVAAMIPSLISSAFYNCGHNGRTILITHFVSRDYALCVGRKSMSHHFLTIGLSWRIWLNDFWMGILDEPPPSNFILPVA